jgi:hypothetical protein
MQGGSAGAAAVRPVSKQLYLLLASLPLRWEVLYFLPGRFYIALAWPRTLFDVFVVIKAERRMMITRRFCLSPGTAVLIAVCDESCIGRCIVTSVYDGEDMTVEVEDCSRKVYGLGKSTMINKTSERSRGRLLESHEKMQMNDNTTQTLKARKNSDG